eukprot:NODE_67_length_2831_cov_1247.475198_g42_i0.p1 GENE.NODE_67_length_2831_cov_1247.475198_g42_i0~~NODE_67_length_2831_cov_1247.475198_g42_i0.p1  ORF type:complete len:333 (-),score=-83.30 NODE_67_length_2831_cov_1247.475198_g42_i0:155-1153(-)
MYTALTSSSHSNVLCKSVNECQGNIYEYQLFSGVLFSPIITLSVCLVVTCGFLLVIQTNPSSPLLRSKNDVTSSLLTILLTYDVLLTAIGLSFILLPGLVRYAFSRASLSESSTSSINPGEVALRTTNATYDCGVLPVQDYAPANLSLERYLPVTLFLALDTCLVLQIIVLPSISYTSILLLLPVTWALSSAAVTQYGTPYMYTPGTLSASGNNNSGDLYVSSLVSTGSIAIPNITSVSISILLLVSSLYLLCSSNGIVRVTAVYLFLSVVLISILPVSTGLHTIAILLLTVVTSNTLVGLLLGLQSSTHEQLPSPSSLVACIALLLCWLVL